MSAGINWGWGGDAIEKQLKDQGFKFKKDSDSDFYEKCRFILAMHIVGLVTDGEARKIINRITARLEKDIEPIEVQE